MGDGHTWFQQMLEYGSTGNASNLFDPHHLVYNLVGYGFIKSSSFFGFVNELQSLQIFSILIASLGCVVLFFIVHRITNSFFIAALSGLLIGLSNGYWFFLNGEISVLATFFLMLAYYALITNSLDRTKAVLLSAAAVASAILLHQENVLFLPVMIYLIAVKEARQNRRSNIIYFLLTCGSIVGITYIVVGSLIFGLRSVGGFVSWVTFNLRLEGTSQWVSFNLLRNAPLAALGFLSSLIYFPWRYLITPSWWQPIDALLLVLSVYIISYLIYLLIKIVRFRAAIFSSYKIYFISALIWVFSYKLLFSLWNVPTHVEFHISTLPALCILISIALTTILRQARKIQSVHILAILFALAVATNNFFGHIQPSKTCSKSVIDLGIILNQQADSDDIFITANEPPPLLFTYFTNLQNIFLSPEEFPNGSDILKDVETLVENKIRQGKKVFFYRLVPDEFRLDKLNAAGHRLSASDFKKLQDAYKLDPVGRIIRTRGIPPHHFGESYDYFYRVYPKSI